MSYNFNKLQRDLYNIVDCNIGFHLECSVYQMKDSRDTGDLHRWLVSIGKGLNKDVIWDFPHDFIRYGGYIENYPYDCYTNEISNIIREYVNTPQEDLLVKNFGDIDNFTGLTTILIAADKRIGEDVLKQLCSTPRFYNNIAARKVIERRTH